VHEDRVEAGAEIVLGVIEELAVRRAVVDRRVVDLFPRMDPEVAQLTRGFGQRGLREGGEEQHSSNDEELSTPHDVCVQWHPKHAGVKVAHAHQ
jgi:hypothetical protein